MSIELLNVCNGILFIINVLLLAREDPLNLPFIVTLMPLILEILDLAKFDRRRLKKVRKKLCFFKVLSFNDIKLVSILEE